MFTQIKTSKKNREVVTILSRKFNLGAENVIARIAFAYSLSTGRKLSLSDSADYQGKEYSKTVLFGSNYSFYLGLICVHYGLYKTDKDIPKYIKMHIDDGLEIMSQELSDNPNLNGLEYLIDKIDSGLDQFFKYDG
jgi:DNA sulfur modification protein DndE